MDRGSYTRKAVRWPWVLWLGVLFAASLDYWRWSDGVTVGWWGLPGWLHWFIGLQLALGVSIVVYNARRRRHEADGHRDTDGQ